MRIFIDESGTFKKADDKDFSISCIGTLVLPDYSAKKLLKKYLSIREFLPKTNAGEVKGRLLNEEQIAKIIDLLRRNDAIFEAILIDMNMQDEKKLNEQIRILKENHTKRLSPEAIKNNELWINKLLSDLNSMSPQLFVQAMLTTKLLHRAIQHATAYYSQRSAKELGDFDWFVDAKSKHGITSAENWWKETVGPFLASTSHSDPAMIIPYGDYSYYDNSYGAELSDYPEGGHDLLKVFSKLNFCSTIEYGLELVDVLTNALRRALVGNLQESGWGCLPDIVIRTKEESFRFILFSDEKDFKRPNAPYLTAYKKLAHGRKVMLSRSTSKLIEEEMAKESKN